ncbi:MAG: ABC transporter permease [Alphaproteobacteria bacterium]
MTLALRYALRELRAGLRGFWIFLACLALGVGAIAAVGSVSAAFQRSLAEEGRSLLGGDLEVEVTLRELEPEEKAWLADRAAAVGDLATMRAMAKREDGTARRLVSLKAVDRSYPLAGDMVLDPDGPIQDRLAQRDGVHGAVAEGTFLRRLDIGLGDRIVVGTETFEIRGEILEEPDAVAGGFRLGPRLIISLEGLRASGLIQVGSLIDHRRRVALPAGASDAEVRALARAAGEAFPDSDWQIRTRMNASPSTRNFVRQLSVFLTLVGLTALIVGGVGVGNAVRSYLDRKVRVIATFKCLGAPGPLIFQIYFIQMAIIAALGIAAGLAIGALTPLLIGVLFADMLPIPVRFDLYPAALALAGLYGVLVAMAFSIWPLARARELPAAGLFRDLVAPARSVPRAGYLLVMALAFAVIGVLAVTFTQNRIFSAIFLAAAAGAFVILRLAAAAIAGLARAAGRPRIALLRLALANMYRPGAPTGSVVLSLGLGLTLLVTVSLIDGNISAQVRDRLPEDAPAFFFVDIQNTQVDAFDAMVRDVPGTGRINRIASLRARIVKVNGVPAEEVEVGDGGRWALRGDRGVTYSRSVPVNSEVVAGDWWPEDYSGPLLLSMDEDLAREFRIGIGDTMTFNLLGRELQARIANLRRLDWETIGLNFIFVFSPGLLETAPHTHVATVQAAPAAEDELERRVGDAFPNVSAVRVREALGAINELISDLALAIRGTTGVTLIAGILVLAGAMAAGHRQRVYDASLLKTFGATRARVIAVYAIEYALLGLATAVMAAGAGTLTAWLVITEVMDAPWVFLPGTVGLTILAATLATIVLGLAGTWRSLSTPAARVLRAE